MRAGRGRRARRAIQAVLVPAWTGVRRRRPGRAVTNKGEETAGVVSLMTSGRDAGPAALRPGPAAPPGGRKPA